jgi:prepilin-type N-terminal cleavage/methylation domain-containing protein
MTRARVRRTGFTLIELMVVIGIVVFLAGITMLVVPTILEKDRSVDAVTSIEGWLQNARLRALRDGQPRGVRFIVNIPPPNPPHLCTEAVYIEIPPVIVLGDGPGRYPVQSPRVVLTYDVTSSQNPTNAVTNRRCELQNLPPAQTSQVQPGTTLHLPVVAPNQVFLINRIIGQGNGIAPGTVNMEVELAEYPDAQMGAGTSLTTYHFGISALPRPLLGEPVLQLPVNTCIDLTPNVSQPGWVGVAGIDYDVLFAPSGQTLRVATGQSTGAAGQIFLWVRDFTKVPTVEPVALGWTSFPSGSPPATYMDALRRGGEQMIVVVKSKSGGIGAAPVYWPDGTINDPYFNARRAASGP